jgi:hypothetical protein
MTDDNCQLHQSDEELFVTDVSDEALESLGTITNASYTLGACTGLSVCPA